MFRIKRSICTFKYLPNKHVYCIWFFFVESQFCVGYFFNLYFRHYHLANSWLLVYILSPPWLLDLHGLNLTIIMRLRILLLLLIQFFLLNNFPVIWNRSLSNWITHNLLRNLRGNVLRNILLIKMLRMSLCMLSA